MITTHFSCLTGRAIWYLKKELMKALDGQNNRKHFLSLPSLPLSMGFFPDIPVRLRWSSFFFSESLPYDVLAV